MDTKSKKWKKLVSFLAFALGIMLTVTSCISLWPQVWRQNGNCLADAFQSDYQNTGAFQNKITGYLDDFLAMATGGSINGYDEAYDLEYWSYLEQMEHIEAVSGGTWSDISEEKIAEINAWNGTAWQGYEFKDGESSATDEARLKELREKAAQAAHKQLSQDKNLLYIVTYNGKTVYTNAEGTPLNGTAGKLPEGYNFLLYFDGEKVTIKKDGQALDVYKDGYYREETGSWCVPGYRNFTTDEKTKHATVTIAAAEQPVLYIASDYSTSGRHYRWNGLYELQYRLLDRRAGFITEICMLAAGLVLLLLYIFMRKHKKEADRSIARATGHIWFEVKLLATAGMVLALFYGIWDAGFNRFGTDVFYMGVTNIVMELGGMEYFGWGINIAAWSTFWTLYLFINDLRYGGKAVLKNSLCGKIARLCNTSAMKLPVQKRLMRPYYWTVGITIATIILAAVLLFSVLAGYHFPAWSMGIMGLLICLAAGAGWLLLRGGRAYRKNAEDVSALARQIEAIQKGDYTAESDIAQESGLREASDKLRDIQQGLEAAVDRQMKSERMKVELITNVSHDVKTPLTAVISYIELLKQEEGLPEHVRDYIRILDEKSQRLKTMVQDVFEVSKAAAGQLPIQEERLDLARLARQTLADMQPQIAQSTVSVKEDIPQETVMIHADGQRLYRVLQNLLQNALKYSLDGSRVYLSLLQDREKAAVRIRNVSKNELASGVDFTQRFVRGDQSRSDGGSGLGLSIAQSFTEACGGSFDVAAEGDIFTVTVAFPIDTQQEEKADTDKEKSDAVQ